MTICMPRVGRNRIHLNQDYSTSRAKTRSRDYKDNDPGNESGKDRHNNSKGHLIRTRNSFLFPLREKRSSRWKRGKEKKLMETKKKRNGMTGQRINYYVPQLPPAWNRKRLTHSASCLLSTKSYLKKLPSGGGHPYVTACHDESRRISVNENPHTLPHVLNYSVQRRQQIEIVERRIYRTPNGTRCLQLYSC